MKTKKLNKRLTFSKSTIADLNSKELNSLDGGGTVTCAVTCLWTCPQTCNTCPFTCMYTDAHQPGTNCYV
jgi:hypothetical protein